MMAKLLVSVRSADEAEVALEGGADIIDVKEPLHGSLGWAGGRYPVGGPGAGELLQDSRR